jgi:hypothetical protein
VSTLDERITRDCNRSGVPFFVEDESLLDRVAAMLVDAEAGEGGGRAPSP